MPKKATGSNNKLLLYAFVALIIIGFAVYFLVVKQPKNRQPEPSATISKLPAQPASNDGNKQLNSSGGVNQGTAVDNNGSLSTSTPPSQWVSSDSGAITVKSPALDSTVSSGFNLSGSSSLGKLQYRLVDDQVGVISQGFINVVNGNFSANIGFQEVSDSGRLDVFSTNADGAEVNEVQLPVKF